MLHLDLNGLQIESDGHPPLQVTHPRDLQPADLPRQFLCLPLSSILSRSLVRIVY
jgi:hypothetical protein